jgi:hypothetical protein
MMNFYVFACFYVFSQKTVDVKDFYAIMCNVYGESLVHRITQSVMLLEGLKGGQV